ncbi:putative bifunctional diguanylate cyclase/phosphodiesterase [Burkholderia ubonensis]|uniref:EAL domain-containing protein n=2 Tax=Burkholderia ubonensis TaxID=101571 RepID=A0AB74DAK2_9BURK|nr:EAL domain-containing protein [Burkholderia ubonensis]PAJ81476.1 GGDEF-domain containing protein [Burkholderia ubonensis]PAJ89501.1 GGDEF-domain containing protein [Burkholderia ubonensis]PAJ95825.1 GGDEF-domain containing protein [Burkholderia ubonensis]PAK01102.1 GGDEF-domain containing protein [Burkholderia ubonensis]PAK03440.1 GGDEF-domain containing protein [Burkholderia ubonensis]
MKTHHARMARLASIAAPARNPDLLAAQYRVFAGQLPVMYLILISSTWSLAVTHLGSAPTWLTVAVPCAMTLASLVRLLHWRRARLLDPTPETVLRALTFTNRLVIPIALTFTTWALLLFPYGDAWQKAQVAFYMAITLIGCVFSLMYLRAAALTVAVIVNVAFIAFFISTRQPTLVATAVNMVFVSAALIAVISVNYRGFLRTVDAQAESRMREQTQTRLMQMIDDMPVAVMTADPETFRINYLNATSLNLLRSIEHLLPIRADDALGAPIDFFHPHPQHQRRLLADPANLPHRTRVRLGPEVLDLQVSAVRDAEGRYIGPMLSWSIVTRQAEAEARIHELAHHDSLTGLPNRATFLAEFDACLRRSDKVIALLFIDLDGFKLINDARGHSAGDEVLRQVAERLRGQCPEPDMMLGRIGGDEFAVLMRDTDADGAMGAAARLVDTLVAPYAPSPDRQFRIGASIGCVLAPHHGNDAGVLLSRADMALYAAKKAGKGTYRMFSPDMETSAQERIALESKLRLALDENQGLYVFYQPIVDVRTRRITTREALLRWHHPRSGWISPARFIPVAERGGLIDRLGRFVLDQACRQAARWPDGARVAVNVSAVQLGHGTIAPAVAAALAGAGLTPDRLEIEVTETALLHDEGKAVADLRALRAMGVRVALDDFGTGFSSLAHLRAFPFDKIKIDGSFVHDAVTRPDCAAVVCAVADLGKRLGVTTVAEGVETEEQLACITAAGCREVQGFLLGRPEPGERDAPAIQWIERAALAAKKRA